MIAGAVFAHRFLLQPRQGGQNMVNPGSTAPNGAPIVHWNLFPRITRGYSLPPYRGFQTEPPDKYLTP